MLCSVTLKNALFSQGFKLGIAGIEAGLDDCLQEAVVKLTDIIYYL